MTYVAEVTADSPSAYWRLGDLLDSSGNGLTLAVDAGTVANAASLLVSDPSNGAKQFLTNFGQDSLAHADDPLLRQGSNFTVEAWVQPQGGFGGTYVAVNKWQAYSIRILGNGHFAAVFYTSAGFFQAEGTTVYTVGNTYHVVATRDASNIRLYVDGALEATTPFTGSPSNSADHFVLGANVGFENGWWGVIDEVALYPTALTLTRIAAHHTAGITAAPVLVHGAAQALTGQSALTGVGHIPGEVSGVAQALTAQSAITGHGRLKIHAIPQALTAQSLLQQVVVSMAATATDPLGAVGTDSATLPLSLDTGIRVHRCSFFENRVVFGNANDPSQQGPDLDVPDPYERQRPPGPVTVGHTFDVARACRIPGIRIWKHPQASGNIVAGMWNSAGVLLKSVNLTWVADAGGWRTVLWDAPVTLADAAEFNVGYYYPTADDHYAISFWNWNTGDSFVYPFRIRGFNESSTGNSFGSWNVRGTGLTYSGGPANRQPGNYYVDPIAEWNVDTPAFTGSEYWRQWENGPDPNAVEIPISVWWVDSNRIAEYKPLGINTIVGDWAYNPDYVNGIKAAGISWWPFLHGNDLSAPIAVQEDPALAALVKGYFVTDEPDLFQPWASPAVVRKWKNDARAIDSTRPVWINLSRYAFQNQGFTWLPVGISARDANMEWREYLSLSDIASLDAYSINAADPYIANVSSSAPNRWGIWAYPHQISWASKMVEERCPVWGYVETASSMPGLPLIGEIQKAVWSCLIAGATGIQYFQHRFIDADQVTDTVSLLTQTELHAGMTALNAQIQSLAAPLLAPEANLLTSVATSTTGGPMKGGEVGVPIHYTSRMLGSPHYVFAQAIRPGTTTGTFTAPSASGKTLTVVGEGRTVVANGSGVWTDVFDEDYEYHLYNWTT